MLWQLVASQFTVKSTNIFTAFLVRGKHGEEILIVNLSYLDHLFDVPVSLAGPRSAIGRASDS